VKSYVPWLAGLAVFAAACGDPPAPEVDPAQAGGEAPGYAAEVQAERVAKDEMFRRDPASPLADSRKAFFQGLEYYPVDPKFRFTGRLAVYPRPRQFVLPGSRGERRVVERYAAFPFTLDGKVHTLHVYRMQEPGEARPHLFLAFSDDTTGRETYPAGRFLDPEPAPDGRYVVDFNRAYSPWCAYGKEYDCPLTPAENRLDVPIPAGERLAVGEFKKPEGDRPKPSA
jgi:uncharacterized protein (DUF1684 family)